MSSARINVEKPLSELLAGLDYGDVTGVTELNVTGVAIDSRSVSQGDLFMAYRGTQTNGVEYVTDAIKAGASAVLIDSDDMTESMSIEIPCIAVTNLRKQIGVIISRFYSEPSKQMYLIGITGTNGKTTVSYMLTQVMRALGKQPAIIGTLGHGPLDKITSNKNTTPDPLTLHSVLADWVGNVDTVAMEVSSHGLEQGRVTGTWFDTAVFTNLSHDHLDYHSNFEAYAEAKALLFKSTGLKHAVINIDDEYGIQLLQTLPEEITAVAYSRKPSLPRGIKQYTQFVYCESVETKTSITKINIHSPWGKAIIETPLLGDFNIDNCLAAFSTLGLMGFNTEQVSKALSNFNGVPGRMERFYQQHKPLLIIDYAHTPDALEKALQTLQTHGAGKLYCVFGCGGNRDKDKRAKMGEIAISLSDHVVLTNDNPRTESETQIVDDILRGIVDKTNVEIIYDRSEAITTTFLKAEHNDVILVAGKGHETTQEIGKELYPFNDRELAYRLIGGGYD